MKTKRLFFYLLSILCLGFSIFAVIACKRHDVHNWDEGVITKEATCTTNGEITYTCTECGEFKVKPIISTGHTKVIDAAVAPTCTATGLTEGKHCSVCNEVLVYQQIVPTVAHSYTSVVTNPTCTTNGYTTHTCEYCGDEYTNEYIAKLEHTYVDYVCSGCGYNYYTEGLVFTLLDNGEGYQISDYTGTDIDVVIPSIYNSMPVTTIEHDAFGGCSSLKSITIPDSVTTIGDYAFGGCSSLKSITIPDGVTTINYVTFASCTSLLSIVIPDSVTTIGNSAFRDCISLGIIYYTGTEEQWNSISIDAVSYLDPVNIFYNYVVE